MLQCKQILASLVAVLVLSIPLAAQTDSPQIAESRELNAKVIKLFVEAKYDEALPLAKRALESAEKALGAVHPELIPFLTNLGELYRVTNRLREARSVFERALAIAEKEFPADIRTARLLDSLGHVSYGQRQEKEATAYFERSLQLKEKTAGPDSLETGQTAFALAELHRTGGDYAKAEPLYERSISIREKTQLKDKKDLVRALQSYWTTLLALKKTEKAAEIQKRLSEVMTSEDILEGGVLNGRAVKLVQPRYPALAREDRASGMVRVQIVIDEKGNVISAKGTNPGFLHLALIAAAEDAALKSKFTPTLLSGKPVKVAGVIVYNFVAQ